jgi:hypothetical protein
MKYQIEDLENGDTLSFRATDWMSFESDLEDIARHDCAYEYKFLVDGESVSFDDAVKAAKQARAAFNAKRAATKKQVWIRTGGVTNAKSNFKQVWVKK